MERYIAICHPLLTVNFSGLRRAVKIVASLWILSLISASPFGIYTTVNYIDFPPGSGKMVEESAFCAMLEKNTLLQISTIVFFIIPMFVMAILYIRMGIRIQEAVNINQDFQSLQSRQHVKSAAAKKNIVRMLGK